MTASIHSSRTEITTGILASIAILLFTITSLSLLYSHSFFNLDYLINALLIQTPISFTVSLYFYSNKHAISARTVLYGGGVWILLAWLGYSLTSAKII